MYLFTYCDIIIIMKAKIFVIDITLLFQTLQLKQPAGGDSTCILVLPPYQTDGYDKFLTELCKHYCFCL